jgi:hypothetical protein
MDYDEQEREFAPLVGKAILSFGLIEFSTLQAAEILPNDSILETAARLQFKARTELLIEILNGRGNKGEAVARLIRLLKQALEFANMRNIIAHNPLLIEVSYDKGTFNHVPKICKYLNREKKVTKQDLINFCCKVEALAEELDDAIHGVLIERYEKR